MTPPNQREDRRKKLTELSNRINTFLRKGDIELALRELHEGKKRVQEEVRGVGAGRVDPQTSGF